MQHTHFSRKHYVVTVNEADPQKARELRSLLRNYSASLKDEVLPGVFCVHLTEAQRLSISSSADQLQGSIKIAQPIS